MAKVKVVLKRTGVKELLRSDEMMAVCKEYADNAMGKLGDGYEVTTHVGPSRVNASIGTSNYDAMRENMENNSILKALR